MSAMVIRRSPGLYSQFSAIQGPLPVSSARYISFKFKQRTASQYPRKFHSTVLQASERLFSKSESAHSKTTTKSGTTFEREAKAERGITAKRKVHRSSPHASPIHHRNNHPPANGHGRFSASYELSVFRPKINSLQFFSWFGRLTGHGGVKGPSMLKLTLKDAMPVAKVTAIERGGEESFRKVRDDILVQFEKAKLFMPSLKEFGF